MIQLNVHLSLIIKMEVKKKVVKGTTKVNTCIEHLNFSVSKKNTRLVQKYTSQLQELLDTLLDACVDAELDNVNETEPWMVEARKADKVGQTCLVQGNAYILDCEKIEEINALQKVSTAQIDELSSLLNTLGKSLTSPDVKDNPTQQTGIIKLIDKRKQQMKEYEEQKIKIVSQIGEGEEESVKDLEKLYRSTALALNQWIESSVALIEDADFTESKSYSVSKKRGPGLKLDRLSLPVFRGNVRHFARFLREFNNTVGQEFSDPKIKVLYLQNQCLSGSARDLVRNLTTFDDVMDRLKDRYGKVSVVIDTVIKDIDELKLSAEEPAAIMALSKCLEMAWDDMAAVDAVDEFCNVVVLRSFECKLPRRLQILWAQEKNDSGFKSSKDAMVGLKSFTDRHRKIAEEVLAMRGKSMIESVKPIVEKHKVDKSFVNSVNKSEQKRSGCFRCGFNHKVKDCRIPSSIKCRRCQRVGHIENACMQPPVSSVKNQVHFNEPEFDKPVYNCNVESKVAVRLPIETINTEVGPCLVLWDSGSVLNLIDGEWASSKGLSGKACNLEFRVVDGSVKSMRTKVYNVPLKTRNGECKVVRAYGLDTLAASVKSLEDRSLEEILASLNISIDIEEVNNPSGTVQLLLGSQCIAEFPDVRCKSNNMCLMSSCYGTHACFIVGHHVGSEDQNSMNEVCNVQFVKETPLHDLCDAVVMQVEDRKRSGLLNDFMSVEELGIRPPPICKNCKNCQICKPAAQFLTLKEYRELNVIKSKLVYDQTEKRWTASYPFLKDPNVLKDNYDVAFRALKRKETKLMKDESLKGLYDGQVSDFIERGVLRKLSKSELQSWNGPVRYVDHHEVFKEGSTTPLRIVINSSFRNGNEVSFNDILMKGPNVLTSLLEVLIRWRLYPVALVGDISKMYHNIKTGELEGHLRRFLWRSCNQNLAPDIYCFDVVTFGDRPAGCIAVCALKATADMFSFVSEAAANVIERSSYMDDVVSGANTLNEAKELASKIERISENGGFKFKGFTFSTEKDANGNERPAEKVLGITWKPTSDSLKVSVNINHNKRKKGVRSVSVELESIPFTRRICLRLVNGIFDPLGSFSPVTVRLKILMKEQFVNSDKYKKWDALLDPEDGLEWVKVLQDVLKLNEISIPRHHWNASYPIAGTDGHFVLVCFADASTQAMCAAVYLRYESPFGEVSVGLLVSKTKVSPVKPATLPRLELCAALLGSRLLEKVVSSIMFNEHDSRASEVIETMYVFLDSKIALGTLNKGSLSDDFTGNCVSEVRGKTETCMFGWVQSEHNVADLGTRGTSPEKVGPDSEWQKGPDWMYDPVELWPVELYPFVQLPTVQNVFVTEIINVERFSSLDKLHKITALCLKFIRSKGNGKTVINNDWKKIRLSAEDYKRAEQYWVRRVSQSVVKLFESGKLQSLRPEAVWDEGQFLKIVTSGRLGKLLKIGYDVEELTILDPCHAYTKLVLKDVHDQDHSGDDRVVWKSRTRYWIPNARREVRKIRKNCYRCRLLVKKSAQQLMAPLPSTRVLPTPAWTYTSLDLFGPIEHHDMVRKRLKEKCWGLIFTCMVSRAVHLDLTQAYDTDALLQAIRRFMSLRGCPKEFLSDQGSQMVACHKEVAVMLELLDWSFVDGWCSRKGISWKFVPPQGQHMNGVTESLIRVTKDHLKQVIDGKRLTFVETQTVLFEVSQVMNSRPLGVYSRPGSDPLDGGPITPNHLLLGRATGVIPELKFENVSKVKRMKFLYSIVVEFWEKWRIVVFHSLVPQFKWHRTQRNVQIGDVVLLKEEEARVADYKLGMVIGIKSSKDGLVRSVKVRCLNRIENRFTVSYLDRPIHKLCVIVPVEEQ